MSSYDQNLLDEAPKATRAQLQEGYNVDLLEQPPRRTPTIRSPSPQTTAVPLAVTDNGVGEKFGSTASTSAAAKSRTSFWRSRNGVIAIVVVALIVVGAVVGGAVGGTVKVGTTRTNSTTTRTSSRSSSSVSSSSVNSPPTQGFMTNPGSMQRQGTSTSPQPTMA